MDRDIVFSTSYNIMGDVLFAKVKYRIKSFGDLARLSETPFAAQKLWEQSNNRSFSDDFSKIPFR